MEKEWQKKKVYRNWERKKIKKRITHTEEDEGRETRENFTKVTNNMQKKLGR